MTYNVTVFVLFISFPKTSDCMVIILLLKNLNFCMIIQLGNTTSYTVHYHYTCLPASSLLLVCDLHASSVCDVIYIHIMNMRSCDM